LQHTTNMVIRYRILTLLSSPTKVEYNYMKYMINSMHQHSFPLYFNYMVENYSEDSLA